MRIAVTVSRIEETGSAVRRGRGFCPDRRRTGGFLVFISGKNGGAYRDRTDDLKLAKLALSQLS